MTLPTTSEHLLFLKDYEAIINASKKFAAETTQIIIIEEGGEEEEDEDEDEDEEEEEGEDDDEDDEEEEAEGEEEKKKKRENKFRAVTTILTECSKHRMLEAFKWHTGPDNTSTRPAEFWEALAKVAPNLQHLSLDFYTHELHRTKEMGISVRGPIF